MDLQQFARVIWRFKFLVLAGIVVAFGLAALTTVRVDFNHGVSVKYRKPQYFKADSILLVTQQGFPWGQAVQAYVAGKGTAPPVPFGDQTRLTNLAQLYAQYANSDDVQRLLMRDGRIKGVAAAQPMITNANVGAPTLPLIDLSATTTSASSAKELARRATSALQRYITAQQNSARIPSADRVVVQQLQRPQKAVIVQGRKKTLPVLVWLVVMLAVLGLAFVLENLRPQLPEVEQPQDTREAAQGKVSAA